MEEIRKVSRIKRVISMLLAILMIIVSVPLSSLTASACGFGGFPGFGGGWGGPLVTTNYKVEFKDSRFNNVTTAESGELFYLMISVSGNNVHQIPGQQNTYRVYITDENLLLPNFAGDGFKDGAVYNGYTLHVNEDGTRYVEFNIKNGDTKVIRLSAKFRNGTTPKGETTTVKVVNTQTGKSASGSIMPESELKWSQNKTEDKTEIKADDIANGVTVNYTLSAAPNNPTTAKGAWWATGLEFTDTISLPAGLTFTTGAQSALEAAIQTAVTNAGYTASDLTVSASGSTATIAFKIDSKNIETGTNPPVATAEMSAVNIKFPFQLSNTTVDTSKFTTAGVVANTLKVNARPSGKDAYSYSLGDNTVSLKVPTPEPANFTLSKSVDNSKKYKPGEEVTFTISATNTGGKAATLEVTDTALDGLTVTEITSANGTVNKTNNTITFTNVAPGATVTAEVVCTISNTIPFGSDTSVWLTNTAKGAYDGKETPEAETSIEVEKVAPAVSYQKTGYTNSGSKYIQGQDTPVTYIITVKNSGNTAGQFEYSDALPAGVTVADESKISASVNSGEVPTRAFSLDGNEISGSGTLEAGQVLTITVKGTLNTTESSVANALTRPDNGTKDTVDDNKTDETITFNGEEGKADISYAKTGYVEGGGDTYTKGIATKVYYTITVKNTGNIEGAFSFEDVLDSDITDISYTASLSNGGSTDSLVSKSGNTITGNGSLPANSTLTVNITGTLKTDKDSIANELDGKTVTFTGKDAAPNFVFEKTGQVGSGGNTYISGDGKEESATYTIKVTNNGTADGTIKFTDKMPDGVTLDAGQTFPDGVTANGNTITVEKELAVGETLTITLNVTITDTATGDLSNTLTGIDAGSGTYGGDTGETFYSQASEIKIEASKSGYVGTDTTNKMYEVGDEVTYEITVKNTGNTAASNVLVTDKQPEGIQFISYQIDSGKIIPFSGDLSISIPSVAADATGNSPVKITIKGKVVSSPTTNNGNIYNKAIVDGKETNEIAFAKKTPNDVV